MATGYDPRTNNSVQFQEDLDNVTAQQPKTPEEIEEEQHEYAAQMAAQNNQERQESRVTSAVKRKVADKLRKEGWKFAKKIGKKVLQSLGRSLLVNPYFWIGVVCVFLIIGMIAIFFMASAVACNRPEDLAGGGWKGAIIVGAARFTSNYLGGAIVNYYVQKGICQYFTDPGTPAVYTADQENDSGNMDSDAQARAYLAQFGIRVNATEPQTSLEGILQSTLEEVVRLQSMCEQWAIATGRARDPVSSAVGLPLAGAYCDIVVTGGTEEGHATRGRCIHENGFKIDLRFSPNLNAFIETHFTPTAPRNGDPSWQNNVTNANYVREDDHWDAHVSCA
jgi:hypothetical protein